MNRTNLHINPRFGVDVTTGCEVDGGTRERVTDAGVRLPRGCPAACKLLETTGGESVYLHSPSKTPASCYAVTPGERYTWSFAYHAPDIADDDWVQIRLVFYDADGANSIWLAPGDYVGPTSYFTPLTFSREVPAGMAFMRCDIRVWTATITPVYVTQLAVEKTDAAGFWFCGATPGYAWDGAADASTSTGDGAYAFTHPGLLFSAADLAALTAGVQQNGLQKRAWEYYRDTYVSSDTTSHAFVGPVDWPDDWESWQTVYFETCASDPRRALAWAYSYYCDPANATTYATRVRDMLLSWASVWVPNNVTDCVTADGFSSICQLGTDQASILFRFALAYDLTRADAVYTSENRTTLDAWFTDLADRQWTFLPYRLRWGGYSGKGDWANDHNMYDYEWRPSLEVEFLHERRSDHFGPAGDACMRISVAALACGYAGGSYPAVARFTLDDAGYFADVGEEDVAHYLPYASFIEHALTDGLTPQNEGDYRDVVGTYAPAVQIAKGPLVSGPDTTDYMSYNLRLHAIMVLIARRLYAMLGTDGASADYSVTFKDRLTASWEYLARLFAPGRVTTPVYDADREREDHIDYTVGKSRLPLGYAVTGSERLAVVVHTPEAGVIPEHYYESELVGPTAMLWTPPHIWGSRKKAGVLRDNSVIKRTPRRGVLRDNSVTKRTPRRGVLRVAPRVKRK